MYGIQLADDELRSQAEQADLIIVGTNTGVRSYLLQSIQNPRKVFVDGTDSQQFSVTPNIRYKAVFKRELGRAFPIPSDRFIFPLPFAAETRYFPKVFPKKDLRVTFLARMETNPWRYSIHQRLTNFRDRTIVSGTTHECAYGDGTHLFRPTPRYHRILARSQIAVSVAGCGYDTGRFWEILAAAAMLFTQEPDIVIPYGFTDGIDYVSFRSLDEFEDKLFFYLNRPELAQTIAERGHQRLLKYHTTRARAIQFIDRVKGAVGRQDYCDEFLHPEIRALESLCVGQGLDIGCGSSKTTPNCIGIDITPGGTLGSVGCEQGQVSVADIVASGDDLSRFASNSMDFIVARHNLEHYHDPIATLREWHRVLRPEGRLGIVVPDHEHVDTYALDASHYCHFDRDSLRNTVCEIAGFKLLSIDVCVPKWSLVGIFQK